MGDGWTAYGKTRQQALEAYKLARKSGKRRRGASLASRSRAVRHWR